MWHLDRRAWRLVALRYLPWLGALSLAWEIAHAPLYTLWSEAYPSYVAFSIVHCTLGDLVIGSVVLALALTLCRAREPARWRWLRIAMLTALLGATYTIFSEWLNVAILGSWSYAESMPRLRAGGVEIGLTPLLQWLVVPSLALYLARTAWIREPGASDSVRPRGGRSVG